MIADLKELKYLRQRLGLTQTQLAKQSGVSQSLIAKIEAGRIDPAFTKIRKITDALERLRKTEEPKLSQIMVPKVVSVSPEASVDDAIKKMKKFGISQMPVVENGTALGLVSERTMLEALTEGRPHSKVRDVMSDAPPQLPVHTGVSAATKLLSYYSLVLISEKGKIKGLVTRSDIIQKAYQ